MGHKINLSYEELSRLVARKQKELLTPRQIAIVKSLALGKNRKQTAVELGICEKTVDFHITGNGGTKRPNGIKGKLGFSDIARLTHWAILNGIVKPGEPLRDAVKAKGDVLRF